MPDLIDVLRHICTGRALLLFGAGPSIDAGLPGWGELAERAAERLVGADGMTEELRTAIKDHHFPRVFEFLVEQSGRDEVIKVCQELLVHRKQDQTHGAYVQLTSLPFAGYLTTNYDDLFRDYMRASAKAITVHSNSPTEIEQVDFDGLPSLVKIHGDFSNGRLILTESDYEAVLRSDDFEYLRSFLKSNVLSRRLLIVGYSLSDPDIQLILHEAEQVLRRDAPIFALLPHADPEIIREWDLLYNIKIFTYGANPADYRPLSRHLSLLAKYSGISDPVAQGDEIDLRNAQRLYMWHKAAFSDQEESLSGALSSVILSLVSEASRDGLPIEDAQEKSFKYIAPSADGGSAIKRAIERLEEEGLLEKGGRSKGVLRTTPAGVEAYTSSAGEFERLYRVFQEQTKLDAENELDGATTDECERIGSVTLEALVDLFHERAVELFNAIFREEVKPVSASLGLFRSLSRHAKGVGSPDAASWVVSYCTRVLQAPRIHEEKLLSYLARAFFCYEALQLNPEGFASRIGELTDRIGLVDSNILIPALAEGHLSQDAMMKGIQQALRSNIVLVALQETVDEIVRAASWATRLTHDYGEESFEVLRASRGQGEYSPNQFLQGFVELASQGGGSRFSAYIRDLFGGELTAEGVGETIDRKLGIPVMRLEDLVDCASSEFFAVKEKAVGAIQDIVGDSEGGKSRTRITIEARVFAATVLWSEIRRPPWRQRHFALLSQGGMLNNVAAKLKYAISPVMTVEGLVEVFRLAEQPEERMPFIKWVQTGYFGPSASLVSDSAARKFFAPVIVAAEEEYRRSLNELREDLGVVLSEGYIEDIAPLDRPDFVQSLKMKAERARQWRTLDSEKLEREVLRKDAEAKKLRRTVFYWKRQARIEQRKRKPD